MCPSASTHRHNLQTQKCQTSQNYHFSPHARYVLCVSARLNSPTQLANTEIPDLTELTNIPVAHLSCISPVCAKQKPAATSAQTSRTPPHPHLQCCCSHTCLDFAKTRAFISHTLNALGNTTASTLIVGGGGHCYLVMLARAFVSHTPVALGMRPGVACRHGRPKGAT